MFWISAFKCTIDWTPEHRYILIRAAMIKRKMMHGRISHWEIQLLSVHWSDPWWDDKCLGGVIIQYPIYKPALVENIQLHTCCTCLVKI